MLKNASNDSPIALNPPFTTGRVGYFVDVANGVTAITVEPTSANNATFAYLNASNTALADADTNKTGFQLALAVGSNEIKVKVTAEDGNTTKIYRVAVLRATITAAAGITVSKAELTVTEEDATGDTYTVVLDHQTAADVLVAVSGTLDTDVSASPRVLTFTPMNWNTPRTVTVTAGTDANTEDETVTLTHSTASTDSNYNGIAIDNVTVTVNDDDTPVALTLPPSAVSVSEGSTQTFTVELASVPAGPVTVGVESGDTGAATVDPASLAFTTTDWSQSQTVTVTGVPDGDTARRAGDHHPQRRWRDDGDGHRRRGRRRHARSAHAAAVGRQRVRGLDANLHRRVGVRARCGPSRWVWRAVTPGRRRSTPRRWPSRPRTGASPRR